MKLLVVVAHPDDELIWMGGFILRNKEWDWTIASMCRRDDLDRKPKFDKVCKLLNAKSYFISDLDDENLDRNVDDRDIEERLFSFLKEKNFDYIFTHGRNGEYGHVRHKEVHNAVKSFINSGRLRCKKAFYFSYMNEGKICIANKKSDFVFKLSDEELKAKKRIITEVYGFHIGGFEEQCCRGEEAFTIEKLE